MKATPAYWYGEHRGLKFYFLVPVSWFFCLLVWLRRSLYRLGLFRRYKAPIPVIIVGNITAGGSGKTPMVIWLARFLKGKGYKPGIVSRGYGGKAKVWPQQVRADSDYVAVGDEAVMLAARTECPMAVGADRPQVIQSLLEHHDIDVILLDDGLQHYALDRDIEIAVVNGERRFGNGYCLPAGPLRERPARLDEVDIIVVNGEGERREHPMSVSNQVAVSMLTAETRRLTDFTSEVHALDRILFCHEYRQPIIKLQIRLTVMVMIRKFACSNIQAHSTQTIKKSLWMTNTGNRVHFRSKLGQVHAFQ